MSTKNQGTSMVMKRASDVTSTRNLPCQILATPTTARATTNDVFIQMNPGTS
jgi:hypothetical protein